ncbi:hypothetical protein D9613_004064 [Agrocybe pediades]|uniref:Pheromone receptor n=1 Tax=Agrocybe pediades TaxID=84607 RepID=A0A8H4QJ59_9AGAR|nr:hypothetical protein D9613_004064 [Agrocybe pediades]
MHSTDPTYPLFPILSFLAFVVALIPLPWHLQAWNSGTCAFMLWTSLACLVEFVNSILWAGSLRNDLPIWCDISSKFLLGAGVGITASSLCISRRLHNIATTQNVSISLAEKRRAIIIDLLIALGIPVLVMALHYVVQPHRYDILEDIGCYAATYNTLPAYFLVLMWPVLLGLISFVYSALTFRAFWKRRLQFAQLVSSNSSLSISRYFRLMMLSVTDMVLTVPLGVFSIFFGTQGIGLAPWISWEDTHYNFSRVVEVPAIFWRGDPSYRISVELTRWLFVGSAFVFFALFGFAGEAQRHYSKLFWACAKRVGLEKKEKTQTQASLPSWKKPADFNKSDISAPVSPGFSSKISRLSSSTDATFHVGRDSFSKLCPPLSPSSVKTDTTAYIPKNDSTVKY